LVLCLITALVGARLLNISHAQQVGASGASRFGSYWSEFSNGFPSSQSFFPISVWDQWDNSSPSSNSSWSFESGYSDLAQAAKAAGINTLVGESGWPDSYGVDADPSGTDFMQAACNAGLYVIAGGDASSNTAADSVASTDQIASNETQSGSDTSCSKYLVGYMIGDEPDECTTNVPQQVSTIHSEDSTRMAYEGMASWVTWNDTGCQSTADTNFAAPDIPAADDYHNTDPWDEAGCKAGADVSTSPWNDCSWLYGYQEQIQESLAGSKPTNGIIETGNDDYSFSEQDSSTCNTSTDVCSDGNEYNATSPQVNADAWAELINGAAMLEWFCDGTAQGQSFAYSDCLGGSGSASNAIWANLKYIDSTIESYAVELNTVSDGACSMQPGTYATFSDAPATTCSNGDLTLATSQPNEPIMGMTKEVDGNIYLFVEADRANGATTGTYKVSDDPSGTATLVYDSAQQYDPSASEQGETFNLNSTGQFSDPLTGDNGAGTNHYGAGANSYQVKIYEIAAATSTSSQGSAPTSGSTGSTTSTSKSSPTKSTGTSTTTGASSSGSTVTATNSKTPLKVTSPITFTPTITGQPIQKVQYYLNKKLLATVDIAPFSYRLDSRDILNGTYMFTTKTYYVSGKTSSTSQKLVINNPFSLTQFRLLIQGYFWLELSGVAVIAGAACFLFRDLVIHWVARAAKEVGITLGQSKISDASDNQDPYRQ
jgi:hypothetical protein